MGEARIRSLVEEQRFFETHWLATEGLIDIDRFSAMFGVFGLAECTNLPITLVFLPAADIAQYVGADLDVMDRDAKKMRGAGPTEHHRRPRAGGSTGFGRAMADTAKKYARDARSGIWFVERWRVPSAPHSLRFSTPRSMLQ